MLVSLAAGGGLLAQPTEDAATRLDLLLRSAERCEEALDYARAESLLSDAKRLARESSGNDRASSLAVAHRLGALYFHTGRFAAAAAELSEAVEISRGLYGESGAEHLACQTSLAALEHARGQYSAALSRLSLVARLVQEQQGPDHPDHASALNNLAGVYQSLGDYARGIALLRQAEAIRHAALGADHEETLAARSNLAGVLLLSGQAAESRRLFAAVAEKWQQSPGPDHPHYASSLTNLAAAEESLGDLESAERHYAQALSIRKQALGPQHPDVAGSLANLATLLRKRGEAEQAKQMLEQALEIRVRALGRWHPDYAVSLNNLAVHHRECQEYAAAAGWYRQALAAQQAFIEATLPALAEQQQITLLQSWRRTLDGYLSIASPACISAEEAYAQVLWWKGRALAGQLRRRSDGEQTDQRQVQLQRITGELSALAVQAAGDENPGHQRRLLEMVQDRERLEAELAAAASRPALRSHSPKDIAAALPPGVVLVDFLEYEHSAAAAKQPQTELTAFVVRRDAPVVRLNLGPASEIRDLVAVWRRTCGAAGQGEDAGQKLRQRVWLPLAGLVGQAAVVLVSPDGCLTRLPLAALPGDRAGSYLLEERAFVVAAVPQLLPQLLARPKKNDAAASLLLVGDIDYGKARQSRPGDTFSTHLSFERLPAARGEILAVRDSFERAFPNGSVTMLRQSQAGEAEFRRAAARHQFIHVVTHGFASESPLPSIAPGLTAGLAFAGANDPSGEGLGDGLLTACEMAGLDLRGCELVVLSACESALGEVAGGEGVLGLQRSCQMAGARSAVASLWKVDDEATRRLMELFYERLCSADAPTSRAEALRQAQLAMLRCESQRGLGIVSRTGNERPRRGAQAWAAFTLSGDWR